jgi:U1 small nuclear ribonucleoprotein
MGDYGNAMMRNQDAGVQSRVKAQSRANLLQLKLVSLRLLSAPYLNPNPSSPPPPFDFVFYLIFDSASRFWWQIGQSHPTGLTTNLLKLFEPRPPLEHKPPLEKRKLPAYSGI